MALLAWCLAGCAPSDRETRKESGDGATRGRASPAALPAASGSPPTASRSSPFFTADSLRRADFSSAAARRYHALRDSLRAVGDRTRATEAGLRLVDALLVAGEAGEIRELLEEELLHEVRGRDVRREARARLLAGELGLREGHADSAAADAGAAMELVRGADAPWLVARGEELVARAALAEGRLDSAVSAARRALAVLDAGEPGPSTVVPERAAALRTLGRAQARRGQWDEAHAALEDARRAYAILGDTAAAALARFELGELEAAAGNLEEALDFMLEALAGLETLGRDVDQVIRISNRIAELYLAVGEPRSARGYLWAAGERLGFTLEELAARELQGRLHLAEGRPGSAVALLSPLVERADSLDVLRLRVTSRAHLARALTAAGQAEAAVSRAREAARLAEVLGDPGAQADALEALAGALEAVGSPEAEQTYLRGIRLLERWRAGVRAPELRMGVLEPRLAFHEGAIRLLLARNEIEGAFRIAESARARRLAEVLGGDPTPGLGDVPAPGLGLGDPFGGGPPPSTLPPAIERLLDRDRALLAYFWGEREVYGWWADAEGVRAARLGSADSLAASLEFLRSVLQDPVAEPDWRDPARYAFRRLVEPLRPSAAREVAVVADGPLAYVPVEVFVSRPGGAPWGSARVIRYAPSASVLAELNRRERSAMEDRPAVLAVADPTARREASSARDGELSPLPHARQEAKAIADMYRSEGAELLLGDEATSERWRTSRPGRFRYLHFATHALANGRDPDRSRIVLRGKPLGLDDIRRLRLSAELVVLSGCETALGPRVRGEGVIGLPHAFLTAGARAVVVTLWRVEDRASADYMTAFYRELRAGRSPAEALQRVRREWIAGGGPNAHPSRWAPFILVGGAAEGDRRLARAPAVSRSSRPRAGHARSRPSSRQDRPS